MTPADFRALQAARKPEPTEWSMGFICGFACCGMGALLGLGVLAALTGCAPW